MDDYDYMWWRNQNPRQNPYTNDSYEYGCENNYPYDEWGNNDLSHNDGYGSQCYEDDQYESYDNDWWCNGNSTEIQYQESPPFSENQERSDFNCKLDQMWEMAKKSKECWEKSNDQWDKSMLNIQNHLAYISEQLNQQPLDNPSDTTHVNEVSSLSSDELYENKVHKPTPPEVDMVVEDYVSLNEKDSESVFEIKEVVIESEKSQTSLHESVTPKVGEGSVEANTTPDPTNLKVHENQPLVILETKRQICFKQPNVVIDRLISVSIYVQNSCRDGMIDVIFGNQKLRLLLFEPTNVPPISGDLVVINTIDDYVYEHTTNMLTDTTRTLESCLLCFRSNALEFQIIKRRFSSKKHDATYSHNSKMKVFNEIKSRLKKFTRKKNVWFYKTRFKRRRLGLDKVKEDMPFDPGGGRFTYDPP